MPQTTIDLIQLRSSDYLCHIVDKAVCFQLPSETELSLTNKVEEYDASLVIFGEGLNLEKLFAVQSALSEWLRVLCFHPGNQLLEVNIVEAQVSIRHREGLQSAIENLAVSIQMEIALLENRPHLDQPGLLVMDMDSTVIAIECIDEIAKLAGVGEQVAAVTEQAMQGKLDFAESLINRVNCLAQADVNILQQVRNSLPIMPGISALLHVLRKAGWKLAIASGGFTFFADYLKQRLDLDYAISNQLEIVDGKLTGKVLGDIVDANTKAQTLLDLAKQFGIEKSQTVALGDGANDLVMMGQAGLGVAFHAKPIVRQQASAAIRFGSANMLLALLKENSM